MKTHAGFEESVLRLIFFVRIELPSGLFCANTSDRHITVDGELFYRTGDLGSLGQTSVKTGTEAATLEMTLAGIDAAMTSDVVNENVRDKRVEVGLALADAGNVLLSDIMWWFRGNIDSLSVTVNRTTSVSASATSRLINWARTVNARYTDEDQQFRHEGDRGFKFMATLQDTKLRWGA